MHLQEGQRISAPFLAGTAEVKRFEPRTGYYRLEVVLQDGHQTYKSLQITDEQLAQVRVVERCPVAPTGNAEDFFFLIEAHRIRLAYQFDPQGNRIWKISPHLWAENRAAIGSPPHQCLILGQLLGNTAAEMVKCDCPGSTPQLAVSISQVDPLPHQIEAVYHYVLNSPRIRFLIADDPGAGKTIMAGLILKELQYRRLVRRTLIVAPGHLKYQWQREMKEKFGASFAVVDRGRMESAWGENVWEEREQLGQSRL